MIDSNIKAAVALWLQVNGNVPCTLANGKGRLIQTFIEHTTECTVVQAERSIKYLLRTVRPIICPEFTPHAYIKWEVGDHTKEHSSKQKVKNDEKNPHWNHHWNNVAKIARHDENRRLIAEHALLSLLLPTDAALDQIVLTILYVTQYEFFNGQTLVQAMDSNTVAVYTGSTKRSLVEEALRWLTERGANNDNYHETRQRNRPVWRYPNNDIIGMKDATEVLGAKSFFVYYCPLILGACYVEPRVRPLLSFFFSINPNTT